MKQVKLSASMMCANLADLRETIAIFEKEGIGYLHVDVMDGEFVPNLGLGVDYIRGLRELTDIPLDLHLMIRNPEYKYRWIGIKNTDTVSIHYESTQQIQRALDGLKPYGCRRFLAINPATPVCMLEEILDNIDGINLLMVNPGFAGQKMVSNSIKKAEKLKRFLKEQGREDLEIEVDGNITEEHARCLCKYGASMFVAGSSSIFCGEVNDYADNIRNLYKSIRPSE